MRRLLLISTMVIGVAVSLMAQGRGGGGSVTSEGGVRYINPGSPTVSDEEATKRPVPRLPDG